MIGAERACVCGKTFRKKTDLSRFCSRACQRRAFTAGSRLAGRLGGIRNAILKMSLDKVPVLVSL